MVWALTEGTTVIEESREQLWQQSRCGVDGADSGGEGEEQLVGAGGKVGDAVIKSFMSQRMSLTVCRQEAREDGVRGSQGYEFSVVREVG